MSDRLDDAWPDSPPLLFGWVYEGPSWEDAKERLATIIVCEFIRWGALP
jgi:hypothetical protein